MTQSTIDPDKLYTAAEIHELELLPYKPRTLIDFARTDRIGCVRLSERKIRFTGEHIKAFIAAGNKPIGPPPPRRPKYANR